MSRFWAVTAYFNPAGVRRRLPNYRVFRRRLTIPLLAVEFSPGGAFELSSADADILIQVRDGDVMWQKERLMNLGLAQLPPECDSVAWLDGDLVFERADWAAAAMGELDRTAICQPFGVIHHLRPSVGESTFSADVAYESQESAGHAIRRGVRISVARSTKEVPNPYRRGHAWCARRELVAEHGFYDGNILGGGDNMILFAATGQAEEFIGRGNIAPAHAAHYREWASRFHSEAQRVTCVEGGLFHLWHGDMEKRRYYARGEILCAAAYDPGVDIAISSDGCWRWNSTKPELHRQVKEYFEERDEDAETMAAYPA
jgi:hypothetical protein